jgi:uncharacterized protein (TIGR02678 family)
MRVAADVPGFDLANYQKAVRTLLSHPLVTSVYPDDRTLPLIRRWSDTLRVDLAEMFSYRLELHGHTARLVRVHDGLVRTRPAAVKDRVLDRQRYAYLVLVLAVLGRAGAQITLGELADAVAADAGRISGLGLDPNRYADRRAFVDAVTWLEERGALRLTDGSASSWASDPSKAEALYDIARDVISAVYRPNRVLQHIGSVRALLQRPEGNSDNARRRVAAQRARRALVENPVVYFAEMDPAAVNHLRSTALVEDLERLIGLRVERRAEGVLLVDTAGFTDARFPGNGAVSQAALLLLGRIADRIVDPDARRLPRHASLTPAELQASLVEEVDRGLPHAGIFTGVSADLLTLETDDPDLDAAEPIEPDGATDDDDADDDGAAADDAAPDEVESGVEHPFISDSFLRTTMKELMAGYGVAFGERWRADPERLRAEAVELLTTYRLVAPVQGGVIVLPLTGRYRNVDAKVRRRREPAALFDVKEKKR